MLLSTALALTVASAAPVDGAPASEPSFWRSPAQVAQAGAPVFFGPDRRFVAEEAPPAEPAMMPASASASGASVSPDAYHKLRTIHGVAVAGYWVNLVGTTVGTTAMFVGSAIYATCSGTSECDPNIGRQVSWAGAGLALGTMTLGGGMMFGGTLANHVTFKKAGIPAPPGLAIAGTVVHAGAISLFAASAVYIGNVDSVNDSLVLLGLTAGGSLLWIGSSILGRFAIRADARYLQRAESKVAVQVMPTFDPVARSLGVVGVF